MPLAERVKLNRDQILELVASIAKNRMGLPLEEFVRQARDVKVDRCEVAEALGLLGMLDEADEFYVESRY